jgi:fluoroacetyl-CoA thioesterase
MKNLFKPGDSKFYTTMVKPEDQAAFHGELLHAVCSTFALARDMEWSSRLFFVELKDDDEEGVGTFLEINHRSPAFVGETIIIKATVKSLTGNELLCDIDVHCGQRVIATGKTGQRMLKKDRLNAIFTPPNFEK